MNVTNNKMEEPKEKKIFLSKTPGRNKLVSVFVIYEDEHGNVWSKPQLSQKIALAKPGEKATVLNWIKSLSKKVFEVSKLQPVPTPPEIPRFSTKAEKLVQAMNEFGIRGLTQEKYLLYPLIGDSMEMMPMRRSVLEDYLETITGFKNTIKVTETGEYELSQEVRSVIKGKIKQMRNGKELVEVSTGIGRNAGKEPVLILTLRVLFPLLADKANRVPTYYPTYDTIPYWVEFLTKFQDNLLRGKLGKTKEQVERYTKTYNEMCDLVKKYYFGSGSPQGQMGRMQAVNMIAKQADSAIQAFKDDNYKYAIQSLMRSNIKRYPKPLPKLVGYDLYSVITSEFSYNPAEPPIEIRKKTNWSANAGTIWKDKKNSEVWLQTVQLSSLMMRDINNKFVEGDLQIEDFWKKWGYIRLVGLMAKAEMYEIADLTAKTRNIAIYNSFALIPAHLAIFNYLYDMITVLDEPYIMTKVDDPEQEIYNQGSFNSSGFSPFNGGMNWLLATIPNTYLTEHGRKLVFTYADNAYIIENVNGEIRMASLDASKMEASVKKKLIIYTNQMVVKDYVQYGAMTREWLVYLTNIFPSIAAESVAIFGNQQIPMNSMGSGTVGTFFYNTVCMSLPLKEISQQMRNDILIQDDLTINPSMEPIFNKWGVFTKTESIISISKHKGYSVIKSDVLGYDAALFDIDDKEQVWLPVLSRDSLLAMILFRKKHYDRQGHPKLEPLMQVYMDLIRYKAAYYSGAWQDMGLYLMVQKYAAAAKLSLNRMLSVEELDVQIPTDPIELIRMAIPDSNDFSNMSESVMVTIISPSLPTIYELVLVGTGDETLALRAVVSRAEVMAPRLLAPSEILDKLNISYKPDELDVSTLMITGEKDIELPNSIAKVGEYRRDPVTSVKITDVVKYPSPIYKESELKPTKDTPPKPVRITKKKRVEPEKTIKVDKIMTNLNKQLAVQIYRVPIPERYIEKIDKIKDVRTESLIARSQMVINVAQALRIGRDEAAEILNKYGRVAFVILPIKFDPKTMTYDRGDSSKKLITEFETTKRWLKPDVIYPEREFL